MTARRKAQAPRDVFFKSAAKATLSSAKKGSMDGGRITALVKNGEEYGLIAVPVPQGGIDVSMLDGYIEDALAPVIKFVSGTDRRLIAFSVGLQGEGQTQKGDGPLESANVVIVGVRTEDNVGRTAVFRKTEEDFEILELKSGDSEQWYDFPPNSDLPSFVAQTVLQSLWTNYITIKNLTELKYA